MSDYNSISLSTPHSLLEQRVAREASQLWRENDLSKNGYFVDRVCLHDAMLRSKHKSKELLDAQKFIEDLGANNIDFDPDKNRSDLAVESFDPKPPQGYAARWLIHLQGPLRSVWRKGVFLLTLDFPEYYPFAPLQIKFLQGPFHPNINPSDGSICLRFLKDQWCPTYKVDSVLQVVRAMLADPFLSASDSGITYDQDKIYKEEWAGKGGGELPLKVYHYTTTIGKESIEKDGGVLKASLKGARGPGVYTTCLHPTSLTKEQVRENNSCKGCDWVIELDVPALVKDGHKVSKCNNGYSIKGVRGDHYLVTRGVSLSVDSATGFAFSNGNSHTSKNGLSRTANTDRSMDSMDIQLNALNSLIVKFEHAASCTPNSKAAEIFREFVVFCGKIAKDLGLDIDSPTSADSRNSSSTNLKDNLPLKLNLGAVSSLSALFSVQQHTNDTLNSTNIGNNGPGSSSSSSQNFKNLPSGPSGSLTASGISNLIDLTSSCLCLYRASIDESVQRVGQNLPKGQKLQSIPGFDEDPLLEEVVTTDSHTTQFVNMARGTWAAIKSTDHDESESAAAAGNSIISKSWFPAVRGNLKSWLPAVKAGWSYSSTGPVSFNVTTVIAGNTTVTGNQQLNVPVTTASKGYFSQTQGPLGPNSSTKKSSGVIDLQKIPFASSFDKVDKDFWKHVQYKDGCLSLPADMDQVDSKMDDFAIMSAKFPTGQPSQINDNQSSSTTVTNCCSICFDGDDPNPASDAVATLKVCKHSFHKDCLEQWFKEKLTCPVCKVSVNGGKIIGTGPKTGQMTWHRSHSPLDLGPISLSTLQRSYNNNSSSNWSYNNSSAFQSIEIRFDFPKKSGKKRNPGSATSGPHTTNSVTTTSSSYSARSEKAYLPFNEQGLLLLELFKLAFRRRVMFGIGPRLSFPDTIAPTFNIHIKTRPSGGASAHGWPDENYFKNCLTELGDNGIDVVSLHRYAGFVPPSGVGSETPWGLWLGGTEFGRGLWEEAIKKRGLDTANAPTVTGDSSSSSSTNLNFNLSKFFNESSKSSTATVSTSAAASASSSKTTTTQINSDTVTSNTPNPSATVSPTIQATPPSDSNPKRLRTEELSLSDLVIAEVAAMTCLPKEDAKLLLSHHEWDAEVAVNAFFSDENIMVSLRLIESMALAD